MKIRIQNRIIGILVLLSFLFVLSVANAQRLHLGNHREIQIPEYAAVRIGPFYSNLTWTEEVGYRYVKTSGRGSGYIQDNRRGEIREDGSDFPIISTLQFQNYMIISRTMDLQVSLRLQYKYYPMDTQEDEFIADLSDEGVFADFSTEIVLSKTAKLKLYDSAAYRTDYVDTRGWSDNYGGEQYERFENEVGAIWDWLMSRDDNMGASLSRTDVIPTDSRHNRQEKVGYEESINYGHRFSPFVSSGVGLNFSQSFYGSGRADAYMYGINISSSAQLTRKSRGNASLGYSLSETSGGDTNNVANGSRGSLTAALGVNTELTPNSDQSINYSRTMSEAFQGGFQVTDQLGYTLNWRKRMFPGRFSTRLSNHDMGDSGNSSYMNWITMISLTHQLSRLIGLEFMMSYDIRNNEGSSSVENATDTSADYQTWITRLSTGLPITEKTRFGAYVEHIQRMSDASNLEYTREIFGLTLSWSHQF